MGMGSVPVSKPQKNTFVYIIATTSLLSSDISTIISNSVHSHTRLPMMTTVNCYFSRLKTYTHCVPVAWHCELVSSTTNSYCDSYNVPLVILSISSMDMEEKKFKFKHHTPCSGWVLLALSCSQMLKWLASSRIQPLQYCSLILHTWRNIPLSQCSASIDLEEPGNEASWGLCYSGTVSQINAHYITNIKHCYWISQS